MFVNDVSSCVFLYIFIARMFTDPTAVVFLLFKKLYSRRTLVSFIISYYFHLIKLVNSIEDIVQQDFSTTDYNRNPHKRTYIFRRQPVKGSYFLPLQSIYYGWGKCEFDKDMQKLQIYNSCILSYHIFCFLRYCCQNIMQNFSLKVLIIQVLLCGFLLYTHYLLRTSSVKLLCLLIFSHLQGSSLL